MSGLGLEKEHAKRGDPKKVSFRKVGREFEVNNDTLLE